MKKKTWILILLVILVVAALIFMIASQIADEKDVRESPGESNTPITGRSGYGEDDPCYHEPHEPDPCAGS